MPRVPSYDGLQVGLRPEAPRPVGPTPGDLVAEQIQRGGRALSAGGAALSRIALDELDQANQVRVSDAMNQAIAARLRLTHDKEAGYAGLQGRAALDRPDGKPLDEEYTGRLQEEVGRIADSLGNDAQKRAFNLQSGQMLVQFRGQVQQHLATESKQFALSTQAGTVKVATDQMALDWQSPDALAQGQQAIKAAVAEAGRLQGLSPAETLAKTVEALSPAHAAVVASALQDGRTDYAKAYMEKVSAELTPQARLQLQEHLKATDAAQVAMAAAGDIWGTLGPKADGQPVELDKMEAAARERYAGDPAKSKATIAELRERASAFNASEKERTAGNVNAVMLAYSHGAGLAKLTAMPQFLALPGEQQNQIRQHVSDRQHMLWARSIEDQNRDEAQMAKRAFPAFLQYSDPAVLGSMSRAQVTALQPVLGNDLTNHLAQKWDGLQKREGKLAASMDQQDFEHLADQMGLKPYDKDNTEDHKRQLGELKFRVEQLIDQAQGAKKAPLERQEKMELMRQEMARQVAVPTWFGLGSKQVPVIQLTPDQAASVAVPLGDRAQIVEALRLMSQRQPNNPAFAPTEDNVRRLYLLRQSPAAGLIPPAK